MMFSESAYNTLNKFRSNLALTQVANHSTVRDWTYRGPNREQ